jgi:2-(1,2-epoxy-1,2-dihydrophenyl)acetyl-CoA isomerase
MATDRLVLREIAGPIGTITLNRPGRHNSLVPELLQELLDALTALREQEGLRAVVLQANGRSFSTGGDVGAFYEHRDEIGPYAANLVGLLHRAILALLDLPVPVVAAVHGIVTGGSIGLVLASDIVLLAPEASFTPYYPVVGFSPDGGWASLLPQLIGPKRAAEVLMRNLSITADQAVDWGLANRIVPAERIRAEAQRVAAEIAAMRPGSIRQTRRLLRGSLVDVAEGLRRELTHFCEQVVTDEAREGMAAFLGARTG